MFCSCLVQSYQNKFVLKDSFEFATDIREQNADLFMASFDIDLLFTKLPLEETIEICVKKTVARKINF